MQFDVAIVGYGPVGMVMAALLGQAGMRVVVLERYAGLYNLPRAAIFDDETMRTFMRLGVGQGLLPKIGLATRYEWRNADGELLIEHAFATVGKSGWGEWYQMYQPDLEDALDRACRAAGVEVRFDTRVTGYTQGDGVTIHTTRGDVTARRVVACDGGNSFTREHLGIAQDDFGFSEPWMVCDFELTSDVELPQARQVCDPKQPISIISLGPKYHRFSFMLDSAASFETDRAPDKVWARVAAYLRPDQAALVRVGTYTFRSLLAQRWQDGHILLAGDAAHQMPPFLGQGMCSGIRDATNLAWRFERDDFASYQAERAPHVKAVIERGIALGRVQTVRDPVAAAARDREMLARRGQEPEKFTFPGIAPPTNTPGAGELFPQGFVDGGKRFDEVVGYGWKTIALVPTPGADAVISELGDPDGTYAKWFADHEVAVAIVRPDFYVYGTRR